MGTPTSVRVDDDLAASQSSVSVGSADDEASRGVQMVDGLKGRERKGKKDMGAME